MVKKSRLGVGMLLSAAAGVVAGLLISDKPGKKIRGKAKELYTETRAMIAEKDLDTAAKEIFGKATDQTKSLLDRAKDEFAAGVVELKKRSKTIDTKKYKGLVDEVVSTLRKDQQITPTSVKKLTTYLGQDIKKFSTHTTSKKKSAKKIS